MDKRPHSPDGNSQALVKRQRTDDQQIIIGSVTKDVSVHCKAACKAVEGVQDLLLVLLQPALQSQQTADPVLQLKLVLIAS